MEPVRLGVIGCGVIGNSHLKKATGSPLAEVLAVADVIEERAKSAAERYGIPSFYTNEDDLLARDDIEAVILAMPTGVRTPIAYKALERRKHVILEKPVASKASEVERMIELSDGLVVVCCSSRGAWSAHTQAAARCVASGALGKIRLVRIRAIHGAGPKPSDNPPPWRQSMKLNGGGILVNWSCYDLDFMMQILDWKLRPKMVLAKWWPVAEKMSAYVAPGSDADSHYSAFILCEDDIVLTMERAEFSSARTDEAWEIIGTDATLHMPLRPRSSGGDSVELDRFVPGQGIVTETIWRVGQGGGTEEDVLEDFVAAIRQGRPPKTDLRKALIMQKITDAIYESSATGRCVAIS